MAVNIPADGYISNNARTEGEVKDTLDDIVTVLRRHEGTDSFELTAGICPAPTQRYVTIDVEGGVSGTDDCTDIATTNAVEGLRITVTNLSDARHIVLKNAAGTGTARMWLAGGVDFELDDFNCSCTFQWSSVLGWVEQSRSFGGNVSAQRDFLGLGNAALGTVGSGNGLDADTVDGLEASAFLLASGTALDADKLDGLDSSAFAQLAETAQQDFDGAVSAPNVIAKGAVAVTPVVELAREDGVGGVDRKASIIHESAADESLELRTYEDGDGGVVRSRFRIARPGGAEALEYRQQADGDWRTVWDDVSLPLRPVMWETIVSISPAVGADGYAYIILPRHCMLPAYTVSWQKSAFPAYDPGGPGGSSFTDWTDCTRATELGNMPDKVGTGYTFATNPWGDDDSTTPPAVWGHSAYQLHYGRPQGGPSFADLPPTAYFRVRAAYFPDLEGVI